MEQEHYCGQAHDNSYGNTDITDKQKIPDILSPDTPLPHIPSRATTPLPPDPIIDDVYHTHTGPQEEVYWLAPFFSSIIILGIVGGWISIARVNDNAGLFFLVSVLLFGILGCAIPFLTLWFISLKRG